MALIFRSESRTFTEVSSVWIVPQSRINVFISSYSGSSILAAPPIQSQRVERVISTPCRGQPALLAVERDVIGILLGDHMSQQSRPGQALGDGLRASPRW